MTTPDEWARREVILDGALDLSPDARAAYLSRACAGDDALRASVERLLAAHDGDDGPLAPDGERPAAAWAAPLVSEALHGRTPAPAANDAPSQVGPWRIIREAGQGGMGTVYLAERSDGAFRMRVALKLLQRGLAMDDGFVRRFREEREILARLDHPNVARLLDGGVTDDARPYYVMEYVDGAPIDRWCAERSLPLAGRLALFARACDAVAEAHAARVVHRDLKPGNIFVTDAGEPKLLDFGIAKLVAPEDAPSDATAEQRASLTETGRRLLTPAYAAPEQLAMEPVTPATDVWALGVVLYELLTGVHPFAPRGRKAHEVEQAILDGEPPIPSRAVHDQRRRALRGDLDAIVRTALQHDPSRRYTSAAELSADVRRHLAGVPVLARGDGAPYRAWKWLRRHRRSAAAALAGMAAGVAVIVAVQRPAPASDAASPARRYFEDGLRALAAGTWGDATRLFRQALAEDSTMAMAAYYGSESASRDEDYGTSALLLAHASRHAARAPERERLLIRAYHADRMRFPALAAYADSLTARYPSLAEGWYRAARAAVLAADYPDAIAHFERAVTLDSAALHGGRLPCTACEALTQLVSTYLAADDGIGAERAARRMVELWPDAANSWRTLALVSLYRGDTARGSEAEGERAYRRAVQLDPSSADWAAEWLADRSIRAADFAAADELLRGRAQTAPSEREERSLGLLVVSLRNQGRWDEALAFARRYRATWQGLPSGLVGPGAAPPTAYAEAAVLRDRGELWAAAALYDSISRWQPSDTASVSDRIWRLAHRAEALAAAGDTLLLPGIADTMEVLATRSISARDVRLPHFVRGLVAATRGDHARAVEAYQRATTSPTMGYTRINVALAHSLVALGRPREAVAALQPALRGSLEVNNTYVTHAELHALLADAWRAAGEGDSGAAHARWVARARGASR